MKAYSQDLRQRVLRAVDAGQKQGEVAKTFAISVTTIKRYLKARRESGHVMPTKPEDVVCCSCLPTRRISRRLKRRSPK